MDLKEIRQIIELMKRNDLSLFLIEREGFKIKLRRGVDFDGPVVPAPAHAPVAAAARTSAPPVAAEGSSPPVSLNVTINSPMVGTFYRSPGPGEPVFVEIGTAVDEGTTVCIIEAMKVMNEIKAEKKGVITRCIAQDSTPVQYDSPLFEIKPD